MDRSGIDPGAPDLLDRIAKPFDLRKGEGGIVLVGAREMGADALEPQRFGTGDLSAQRRSLLRSAPDPAHSGIDLEVYADGFPAGGRLTFDQFDHPLIGDEWREPERNHLRHLFRERKAEQ